MKPPVPKIRTEEQLPLVGAVPDNRETAGLDPVGGPVLSASSPGGGQVRQGGDRLAAIRAAKAERRDIRAEFADRRKIGVARRHAAKLARNASERYEP